MNIVNLIVIFFYFGIIFVEINYYRKGWGLNFHVVDLKDQDGWVTPRPTKFQRIWLLIAIIAKMALGIVIGIPLIQSLF